MFARHGIRNALRTPKRSVAFLLLMTLLVTLLGTSLGLSFALQRTLRQCRENYSTIGLVEYLGPGYPSNTKVVADAGEVLAEFEEKLDREDPALVAHPHGPGLYSRPGHADQPSPAEGPVCGHGEGAGAGHTSRPGGGWLRLDHR